MRGVWLALAIGASTVSSAATPVHALNIVRLTNNAPRNRMSLEFMDALETEVERLADDSDVRAVVIRGAGEENFSVGMDLKQLPAGIARIGSPDVLFDQRLQVLSAIENLPKPVIAVLYGYCLGGGLELPLACHFRFAAVEGATIGLPELDLGTVPAWGGSARLTRCIGRDHALDMILRAKKIPGPEALRIGLVNEVWPIDQLFQRAQDLAFELAEMPATAVGGCFVASLEPARSHLLRASRRSGARCCQRWERQTNVRGSRRSSKRESRASIAIPGRRTDLRTRGAVPGDGDQGLLAAGPGA